MPNRRNVLALAAAAGAALPAAAVAKSGAQAGAKSGALPYSAELGVSPKAWAKANLKGLESFILPSVKPDLKTLDEPGIRRDVQHAIDQGFLSVLPVPVGLDPARSDQLSSIVAHEAQGRILVVGSLSSKHPPSGPQPYSHALLAIDPSLTTEDAICDSVAALAASTPTPLVLYAAPQDNLRHLHPSGVPISVFSRLAELPSVVAVKFTQTLDPATAREIAEAMGDRLVLGPVHLGLALLLAEKYPVQWSGQWAIDALQSPEAPHAVQFMRQLSAGQRDAAAKTYWRVEPAARRFYGMQAPYLARGEHPWLHIKYYQWLTGGNGGLLPASDAPGMRIAPLDGDARRACRAALAAVGAKLVDLPDDVFVAGSAAYARGLGRESFTASPQYVA